MPFKTIFNNADEILVSYTYIPEYLKKTTENLVEIHDGKFEFLRG